MNETPGTGETGDGSAPEEPRRGWVPDDTTPHTYAVPSGGVPAPEAPLPPVYGHPMPSLSRRKSRHRDGDGESLWRRLRRTLGRVFPAFDVSDDHR
jgi:hypothetical protein